MPKPQALNTPLTEMFDLDFPIIGAPMFLVSNFEMVQAASLAGGMGSFPALNYRPIEKYEEVIVKIKKEIPNPAFAINVIVQKSNKHQHKQIEIAIEQEVPLIITSLGNPKEVIKKTRGSKTKVFCDVVGLQHAKKVADQGADGLIVVGSGAGGHGGETSILALLPYLKKHIDLPMVAAGCISDGQTMASALSLGADGVYMGTRIIASHEAQVNPGYKKAIVDSGCDDIVNTDRVDGFPGNFIRTEELNKILKPNFIDNVLSQNKKVKRAVSLMRAGRALLGSPDQKLSYKNTYSAGHGVGAIDEIKGIQDIFWETIEEYRNCVEKLPR